MRKRLIAIALMTCFAPAIAQQPSDAQVVESMVGGSACAASVGCGVVVGIVVLGGVAYYVLNANGRKYRLAPNQMEIHAQPIPQAGPRISPRGDMRTQYNEPGKREVHAVSHPAACDRMLQKFLMQGRKLKLVKKMRTTNPMLRYDCIFEGPDAQEGWFNDRRYPRRDW